MLLIERTESPVEDIEIVINNENNYYFNYWYVLMEVIELVKTKTENEI